MTKTEVLDYNKQCADIIGWLKQYNGQDFIEINSNKLIEWLPSNIYNRTMTGKYQFDLELCKFHSDWNWIMKVIEKIKETITKWDHIYTMSPEEQKVDYQLFKEDDIANRIEHLTMYADKETVVQAIAQFLIWYEQNKL